MSTIYKRMPSPLGDMMLVAKGERLTSIMWDNGEGNIEHGALTQADNAPILLAAAKQLGEYFAGERRSFDLELEFEGTDFQREVWNALRTIPYGQTRSYQQIAEQIGNPKACRAVGAANGRNRLAIVVPCHRVIGANGALTGFAAGMNAKSFLLNLESGQSTQEQLPLIS